MAFDKPQSRNEAILQNMLGANNELEPPKSRVEVLLQDIAGQMPEANPSEGTTTGTLERLKIGDDIYTVEGGGSGTSDYDALNNKPQIAGVTLSGDKSLADLGIASATTVSGILDGASIDSFADVETALSDKQNTLTFDDTPTDGSNNPVKSNGIYDALATKQDATDNSLDTDAKTIVGAINEHDGDIDSLKSGFTALDNEVNGDATVYPYADVITIEDAVPANLADCSVKVEPVQDLHGYDKPWVGGAGDNKFSGSDNTYTRSDQSATKWLFANVPLSSEFTGAYYISFDYLLSEVGDTGEVLFYGYSNGTQITGNICKMDDKTTSAQWKHFSGLMTKSVTFDAIGCYTDDLISIKNIMVSATEGDFAPYTNICPISGHTEAVVTREGKNLLDASKAQIYERYFLIGGVSREIYANGSFILDAGTYTFSFNKTAQVVVVKNDTEELSRVENVTSLTFTINERMPIRLACVFATETDRATEYQLELGSTATPYEPYAGQQYTLALGDTIYGGTVDFDSGVMSVTKKCVDLGSLDFTYDESQRFTAAISDMRSASIREAHFVTSCYLVIDDGRPYSQVPDFCAYAGWGGTSMMLSIHDSRYSDAATYKTAITGQKICYELATPFTVQLTPKQIQLLKGQNTLTASTGDISVTVNGVSGSIGAVQTQANATDAALAELAADIAEQLPTAPTTDGAYVLTVTVADGAATYSWESTT